MANPPFAQVLASINGGAASSGGLSAAFTQTVQLSAASTIGWTSAIWELYDTPPGFTTPSGWTRAASGVVYFQPANPTTPPPVFSIPASGSNNWGKWAIRLRINGNPLAQNADGSPNQFFQPSLTDETTFVRVSSPNLGMHGLAFNETTQYDTLRAAVGEIMQCLRAIDGASTLGGGFIPPTGSGLLKETGGTLNGAAFIGTAGQFPVVNAAGTDVIWVTLDGDVTAGSPSGGVYPFNVTGLLGHTLPSLATGFLEWTGSAWAFVGATSTTVTGGAGITVTGGPAYGVALTSPVTVSLGGTGLNALNAHAVLVGAGTSPLHMIGPATAGTVFQGAGGSADPAFSTWTMASPGASGNVLTSDGTNWTSAAAPTSGLPAPAAVISSSTVLGAAQFWALFTGGTYPIDSKNIPAGTPFYLTYVGVGGTPVLLEHSAVTLTDSSGSYNLVEYPSDRSQPQLSSQPLDTSWRTYVFVKDATNGVIRCIGFA